MNTITNIIEPNRLLLAWQPLREVDPTRTRRAVGEIIRLEDEQYLFRYLVNAEDYKIARSFGLEQYIPFSDIVDYEGRWVLEIFAQRLPPRSRRDFGVFLKALCLPLDADISDFALLGYSGCYLPSDGFSIVNTFDGVSGDCQFLLEIAGAGYYADSLSEIGIGKKIVVSPEPDNKFDPNAIMLTANGKKIGNINRLMLPAFHRWLTAGNIDAVIERIEGTAERPRIFALVSV